MPKDTRGRKPFHELHPELFPRLYEALQAGNYVQDACAYAGFSVAMYHKYENIGSDERDRRNNGETPDPQKNFYVDFVETVEKARADAIIRNVTLIQTAARDTWQAAAWWLERTRPQSYGRRTHTEITGKDGGPVEIASVEALDQRIAQLLGEKDE